MQTVKPTHRQDVRLNLLYWALGLPALSLLVAWSVELFAQALFLKW
jgi:hypothetical protein